jgi:hypothetical protein
LPSCREAVAPTLALQRTRPAAALSGKMEAHSRRAGVADLGCSAARAHDMRRLVSTIALVVIGTLCGCGTRERSPGRAVVGRWLVVSIDGTPVPKETTIEVNYESGGRVSVQTTGNAAVARRLDREKLKAAMAKLTLDVFFTTISVAAAGLKVERMRKPGMFPLPRDR